MNDLWAVVGVMAVLIFLWFLTGGPSHVDVQHSGIFLNPPPPIGNGASYGPQIGGTTTPANPPYHYQYQY